MIPVPVCGAMGSYSLACTVACRGISPQAAAMAAKPQLLVKCFGILGQILVYYRHRQNWLARVVLSQTQNLKYVDPT
jgi:hypothetical protein